MLKSEKELYNLCTRTIKSLQMQTDKLREITEKLVAKYDCDITTLSDLLSMRRTPDQIGIPLLFLVLNELKPNVIKDFFTDKEIKSYSSASAVKRQRLKFPLQFNVIEIVENCQWIGRITVKELMLIRDAQKIHYDPNAQRPMKYVDNGVESYYKIYTNETAIRAIQQSYKHRTYIPDTITFNMPDDTECEYDDGVLTITHLDHFDITDGYHRYVAMNREFNENPDFDYPMEFRITRFPLEKTRHFIWQADQKTKMKKCQSDAFNQDDAANQVVNELKNKTITSDFIGSDKRIPEYALSGLIRYTYFRDMKKRKSSRQEIVSVRDELHQKFVDFIDYNPEYERKWKDTEVYAWFYLAQKKKKVKGSDVSKLAADIDEATKNHELLANPSPKSLMNVMTKYA